MWENYLGAMMWKLKNARGTFLDNYRFKVDRSFWWHLADQMAAQAGPEEREALRREQNNPKNDWMKWRPTNSNCPELSRTVNDLVDLLPAEWQATGRNIFVGIAPLGEINAEAWNLDKRGVIEINLQYLWALESYVLAFDEFRSSAQRGLDEHRNVEHHVHEDLDYGDFKSSWDKLDKASEIWRDQKVIAIGDESINRRAPGRTIAEIDGAVAAATSFITGHELGHHLMAHTSGGAKRRADQARELIRPLLSDDSFEGRGGLRGDWRNELEADLVAVAIMCRKFNGRSTSQDAYAAIMGSFIALICANHGQDLSTADPGDVECTHPPLTVRLGYIGDAIRSWYADSIRGEYNDHPIDFLNQMEVFVELICAHQSGEFVSDKERIDATNRILLSLIDRSERLIDQVPVRLGAAVLQAPEHRSPS